MLETKEMGYNCLLCYIAIEIDTFEKKYDIVKAESVANCGQLIADAGHKLTTEIQMAKKELLEVIDKKVNEVGCESREKFSTDLSEKADRHEMRDLKDTQVKYWNTVKTVEADLSKMQEKIEKHHMLLGQKINCEQLSKDVKNQLGEIRNATKTVTDDLSKEIGLLQKNMKGWYFIYSLDT